MNNVRIIRIIGSVLFFLGLGSAFMRTQLDMDTILTAWMGGAQPWSGVAMALVGVACWVVAATQRSRAAAA